MERNRQEQVISVLKDKDATQPCPRCRSLEFEVIGESMMEITREPSSWWRVGSHKYMLPAVPVVLISCTNCGYIVQHAAGPLGLVSYRNG
jgi:predicted nucleic-acid-binding Zn-ribbon protein